MKPLYLLLLFLSVQVAAQEKFTVYFDTDSDQPTVASTTALEEWINSHREVNDIKIYGYADTIGDADYNFQLANRRTIAVSRIMINQNFLPKNQEFRVFGESESASGTNDQNRRVEILYTPERKGPESELAKKVRLAKKGDKLELKNIEFVGGSHVIRRESDRVLRDLLRIMQEMPSLKIAIQGHICCMELDEENLSKRTCV